MRKHSFKWLLALMTGLGLQSQAQTAFDQSQLQSLCGCFEVDFRYAETFSANPKYEFHEREHQRGLELVLPIEQSKRKWVMQHILVINDTMFVKHWREDWVYEPQQRMEYKGNKTWSKTAVASGDSKGKWMQSVWEVDDAPRYQGIAAWQTVDGKPTWKNTADAPLPRREYTKRSDYDVLRRTNNISIDQGNWYHEQDNDKVKLAGASDTVVAQEKGMNYYKKVDDSRCAKAITWWKEQEAFWVPVRQAWADLIKNGNQVQLTAKVDGVRLDQALTRLYDEWKAEKLNAQQLNATVATTLAKYAKLNSSTAKAGR